MEAARLVFGLAAAVVVPWGLGWQRSSPGLLALFTFAYAVYTVAPYRSQERPWIALGATLLVAGGSVLWHRTRDTAGAGFTITLSMRSGAPAASRRLGLAAFGTAALLSLWAAGATTASLGVDLLLSDRTAVVTSALLISVFGGGVLAKAATGPVRREIDTLQDGPARDAAMEFMSGGPIIGMLERGLLFAFLMAGQPEAAALVLAAKSLARVPTAEHGKHASEYFLIGTLASVIAALTMSMAARTAIGLPVL
ncbi:hypothetical protein ABTZ93_26315 [Streptomyces sp. NPDC097941]|uniref:hypothetical protein n=1 Tax=Streptomyces sp. NPDC097941 TaxID=3155685 RepID=UPI003326E67E